MPRTRVNGAELYYEDTRSGREAIVFAHGLLWSGRMYDGPVAALRDRYRCITYDHRGQGQSEITRGGYDMDTLTEDAAALIRELNAAPCHFAGLSMGGFIGLRLALRHPELLRSLILLNTSADAEEAANIPGYRRMALVARWISMRLVAGKIMPIMFGPRFLTDPARAGERAEWLDRLRGNNVVALQRATEGVVTRAAVYEQINRIRVPTLIIAGERDVATVPAKAERMHRRIPGSRLVEIPESGHSSTIEEPAAVTRAIEEFLRTVGG